MKLNNLPRVITRHVNNYIQIHAASPAEGTAENKNLTRT